MSASDIVARSEDSVRVRGFGFGFGAEFGFLTPLLLLGPNSIGKFWLEFRLEKSFKFRLEIPLH